MKVLERVGGERMMLKLIRKRKRKWLGHWLRRNYLLKDALEGMDDNNALKESAMRISYKICHEIAKELKTCNEGEFIKRCLIILADELCPQQVGEVEAIRLSRRTVSKIKTRPSEIHREMLEMYGADCLDRSNISTLVQVLQSYRINVTDEARSGRPVTAATPPKIRGTEAAVIHPTAQILHRLSFTYSDQSKNPRRPTLWFG
ncbi:hypothetical protein ANN_09321 [Periplaneta americana]|uniref:Uncharacterized protein n=1 Tax=Periplaneta americana TaxID=6978 RepID=A0ABQ8TNJ0_PERAM|nr:hypothetical protein ANN_09321 [Periplaneta americana]